MVSPIALITGAFTRIFQYSMAVCPPFRKLVWKIWYEWMARKGIKNELLNGWDCMNYGYQPLENDKATWKFNENDANTRFSLQLYQHVSTGSNIKGKKVLEVGCGRGGGASFVSRELGPQEFVGLDYSQNAVEFCEKKHAAVKNLSFKQGDAEDLPFEDGTFDCVINVESSHCYGNVPKFFSEVKRVLKTGGHFCMVDLRGAHEIAQFKGQIQNSGLKVVKEEYITANVVKALEMDHDHKMENFMTGVPVILQKPFMDFAGFKGTWMFERFRTRKAEYLSYVMKKE